MAPKKKTPAPMAGEETRKSAKEVVSSLEGIAREVYDKIAGTQIPSISLPTRTKGNIVFSDKEQVWKYGTLETQRTAKTLEGAYMLARTMYSVDFIKQMIAESKSSTLREMYYISEGWGLAKFHAQDESDKLIEDLEIRSRQMREELRLRPEENGASIIGNITIEELNRKGEKKKFNCRDDVGDGGYGIPYNVEKEKIRFVDWDAKFVIAIECLDADEPLVVRNGHHTKTPTIGSFVDTHLVGPGTQKLGDVEYSEPRWPVQVLALSPDGALGWKRVTRVMRQPLKDRMLRIRTAYNLGLRATGSHKMVVYDDFGFAVKRADELKPGDLVPVANCAPEGERPDGIDVAGTVKKARPEATLRSHGDGTVSLKDSPVRVPARLDLTPELFRLLGYFASEGSNGGNSITLSFGRKEQGVIDDAKHCIQTVFGPINIWEEKAGRPWHRLVFGGILAALLFKGLGCGAKAGTKRVPWPVLNAPVGLKREFLLGCLRGDGAADIHGGKRVKAAPRVRYGTCSRLLAADLATVLGQLGIGVSVLETAIGDGGQIDGRKVVRKNVRYTLNLRGEKKLLALFGDFIREKTDARLPEPSRDFSVWGFPCRALDCEEVRAAARKYIPSKERWAFFHKLGYSKGLPPDQLRKFLAYIPAGASRKVDFARALLESNVALVPVKEVSEAPTSSDFVYDLTVEDAHTFAAGLGNIVTHNCGGMFDRLAENGFDEKEGAVLVHLKGQPARCTRRLVKRLNDECKLPVVVFTDGDPWSFRIFASVAYGAIKTAHISEYLATPEAQFVGVTPSDIENYKLPSDKLNDQDIRALKAELSDPRFRGQVLARRADGNEIMWEDEIKLQLELNKKSEQQALAKYGLNFVTDNYLPEKLSEIGVL